MVAIMGTSTVVVYKFFEYNIYQQLDSQLLTLANAAAHSLPAVKAERSAIRSKVPGFLITMVTSTSLEGSTQK
jgi:hypothetical protein